MRNLQDYINKYSEIASNLGYQGSSVDVLVQLLANASYIGEVENVTYMKEASIERSSLVNSKIQHCVDSMYSVFRGSCPRVILKIKPLKYLELKPYTKILDSQTFKVYYLGYYKLSLSGEDSGSSNTGFSSGTSSSDFSVSGSSVGSSGYPGSSDIIDDSDFSGPSNSGSSSSDIDLSSLSGLDDTEKNLSKYTGSFIHGPIVLPPSLNNETYIIEALLSVDNPVQISQTITSTNTYYIQCLSDNLSSDMYAEIDGQSVGITRNFADHILRPTEYIFDLTLPSFGSRLYLANYYSNISPTNRDDDAGVTVNTKVSATWFKFSELLSYNESELRRLRYSGADLVEFNSEWLIKKKYSEYGSAAGIRYLSEVPRSDLNTIHYKANRDRYVNSIIRSNSDIGTILEEDFPGYVISGGTSYVFNSSANDSGSTLTIYYIPVDEYTLIPEISPEGSGKGISSLADFIEKEKSYYIVTQTIKVKPGTKYIAKINVSIELFQNSSENLGLEIGTLLKSSYAKKFNIEFTDQVMDEIRSLVSKYSNVKRVGGVSITYYDSLGFPVQNMSTYDPKTSYFDIEYSVSASVYQTS